MSRFCIFALFLVVVFQFGNCSDCNITSKPGSDTTTLSFFETIAKDLLKPVNKLKEDINKIKEIIKKNSKSSKKLTIAETLKPIADKIHLIFPGTLWCGDGDIAKKESDLGLFNKTDACCRAHDNCNDDLLAGKTKANLKNNGIFTKSACTCDTAFYNCLKNASTVISNAIGTTYFNLLKPQCYECEQDCSVLDCNFDDRSQCKQICKQYKWDDSQKY